MIAESGWDAAWISADAAKAAEAAKAARIAEATAEAAAKYPKLAGKTDAHHVRPQYLGGAKNGPRVAIDAAYHQLITNEFRRLAPYRPAARESNLASVDQIIGSVSRKYPLP